MRRRVIVLALLIALASVAGLMVWWAPSGPDKGPGAVTQGVLSLVRPAFAQQGSFLNQEAGFAAWTKLDGPVNLSQAKKRLKTLDTETADYLIGEIDVSKGAADRIPHVYLTTDGWLVAYFFNDTPAAHAWSIDIVIPPSNFLLIALGEVAAAAGSRLNSVAYYHFQYPFANKVLAIYGHVNRTEVMVPSEIHLNELSVCCSKFRTGDIRTGEFTKMNALTNWEWSTVVLIYRDQ